MREVGKASAIGQALPIKKRDDGRYFARGRQDGPDRGVCRWIWANRVA